MATARMYPGSVQHLWALLARTIGALEARVVEYWDGGVELYFYIFAVSWEIQRGQLLRQWAIRLIPPYWNQGGKCKGLTVSTTGWWFAAWHAS